MATYSPLINGDKTTIISTCNIRIIYFILFILMALQACCVAYMVILAKMAENIDLFNFNKIETTEYIDSLQPLLPKTCQIWKALPVESEVTELKNNAQFHILDGKNAGSGETFNWRALAESEQDLTQCFLAGGLSIDNIEQAISQKTSLDLFGLDLNSGVETSPGVKSREKLQQVFAAIRHY